jgi:hypothetical protein
MLAGEAVQLAYELGGQALTEISVDAKLDRLEAQLLESADFGLGEVRLEEVLIRLAPPQGQSLADRHRGGGRVRVEERPPSCNRRSNRRRIDPRESAG